jgi:hypothetical protein
VIDSTYRNERKCRGVLTVLGEEPFNVPVEERTHETWLHTPWGLEFFLIYVNLTRNTLDPIKGMTVINQS